MVGLRAVAVGLVVLAAGLWPAVGGAAPACAAASGPRAGLVIDDGVHVRTFCVALDAPTVSGLHLIELAGEQYRLPYSFGLGGLAVCRLNGVGPTGDDCFADYPDYWGYWHGDGHGGWTWASSGAGDVSIASGDVDAWSWGSGDGPTTHPTPGASSTGVCVTTSPTIVPTAAAPTQTPPASRTASPTATQVTTSSADPSPTVDARTTPPGTRSPGTGSSAVPTDRSTRKPDVRPVSAQLPTGGGGTPLGLVVATVLALLLATGGWLRVRDRRKDAA